MTDWRGDLLKIGIIPDDMPDQTNFVLFNLDELANHMIKELDKAREEGRREVLEDMRKMWDNDNLGDAPKYGSAGAGLMKRWIRDDINERLSKLTTK
jgi:hypothetical protein